MKKNSDKKEKVIDIQIKTTATPTLYVLDFAEIIASR